MGAKPYITPSRFLPKVGITITALFALVFAFLPYKAADAMNERVVTMYYDGVEQTVVTDAATVGEVLTRAEVAVGQNDLIEPSLDTQLTAPSYNINIYRARPVTIVDGTLRYTVITPHTSAAKIAEAANLPLYAEDVAELSRINEFLADDGMGLKLSIDRAVPLTLVLYGKQQQIRTQVASVDELVHEKGIVLGAQDGTNVPMGTPVTADMRLEIWRNGAQVVTEEKEVPFITEYIRDADKPTSFRQVQTPGVVGKKLVTYEVTLRDGQEVARKEIQSVEVKQPAKQVEVIGVQLGFGGSFKEALAKLRACEAGGRYDRNSGNGYYGAYQFDIRTWANYGGYERADLAPPEVQDQKTYETYMRRGWTPWPGCTRKLSLQDIYR